MCPAQGEADARFSDPRRGHQARLPRGRRGGDGAVPSWRHGRVMGSAAGAVERRVPRHRAGTSGLWAFANSRLDDERRRSGVLLPRRYGGARSARCASRRPLRRRLDRAPRWRSAAPRGWHADAAGAGRRRAPAEACFGDVFFWTHEEFARRQFHDPVRSQEDIRRWPEPTSMSCCRTAPRLRASAGHPRLENPQLRHWLHRIDVPTLLIWGKDDEIAPFACHRPYVEEIRGAELLALPQSGHACRSSAPTRSRSAWPPSSTEHEDEDVLFPPHAVCGPRSVLHRAPQLGVGDAAQFLFRSRGRHKALPPLHRRAGARRRARFRRHLRQRAPPECLWPDAGAEPDRGIAGAHHKAGQDRDPRPRAAAGEQSGQHRGRVRHARPD